MRTIDRLIRPLMWLCLAVGLLILARIVYAGLIDGKFKGPVSQWITTVLLFGTVWLPPALSLWLWDGARPGAQSLAFYVVSALAVLFAAFDILLIQAIINLN